MSADMDVDAVMTARASVVSVAGAAAAGADVVALTASGRLSVALRAVAAKLVTSAAVANRVAVLQISDGDGNLVAAIPAATAQVASSTVVYSWSRGVASPGATAGGFASSPVPAVLMLGDWTATVHVDGIDVADQLSEVVAVYDAIG